MPGKSKDATNPAKMKKFQFDDGIPQRLQKKETTINEVKRENVKNGGSMSSNHEQLTGWGNVRSDVKKFGKK